MIPRRCRRCARPVWVWPWQNAYCRDFETCIEIEWAMSIEGDIWHPDWREPEPCPWANPPPLDIDVCSQCRGLGEVQARQDWETGAIEMEHCGRCDGSGMEPTWLRV